MSHKPPRPTTRSALLRSAGYGDFRVTKHTHVDTRECVVGGEPAWEHVFKCDETGEERRWGTGRRTVTPDFGAAPAGEDNGGN